MTKFSVCYYGPEREKPYICFECDDTEATAAADLAKAIYDRLAIKAAVVNATVQHVGQTPAPAEAPAKNKGGRPRTKQPPVTIVSETGVTAVSDDLTSLDPPQTPATPPAEPRQISTGENRVSPEDAAADLWSEAAKPAVATISDRDVTDAITRKVAADKALTPKVKKLIADTGAMSAGALPQEKRAAFLAALEVLK